MDHSPADHPLKPLSWPDLLAVRPRPPIAPRARSVWVWGAAAVHRVALRSAARAVASGGSVALIDGGMAFQVTPVVAMAKACRIPPDLFLRRLHLARAFTCWQFTTLLCERLGPLLASQPISLVVLLDPLTHFFDEDITFKEAALLFRRVRHALTALPSHRPRVLLAQTVPTHQTPRRVFARGLLRVVDVGLRLMPDAERGSVEVVKPRPSRHIPPAPPP